MKLQRFFAFAFLLGVLGSTAIQAQDQKEKAPAEEGRRGRGGRGAMTSPEERVAELDKVLSLTDAQKTKIKEIYAKAGEEMRNAFRGGGGGGDREAARGKMTEMMRKTREDVRALLTDEQKKKFDEMPQRGGPGGQGERGRGKRGDSKN